MFGFTRREIKRIFLDMDGTLVDPRKGFLNCVQHALASVGSAPPDLEYLLPLIGFSLEHIFRSVLPNAGETVIASAIASYRERFASVGRTEVTVYPGMIGALQTMTGAGASLFVVTLRAQVNAVRILDHLDLSRYFQTVYGPELGESDPDKAVLIQRALRAERLKPGEVVMVGDRADDVRAAKSNRVKTICVTWGYEYRDELEAAKPERIVSTVEELLVCLGMTESEMKV